MNPCCVLRSTPQACHRGCLIAAAPAVHGVETMEGTPDDPRRRGKVAALRDRVRSGITALMSPMSSLPLPTPCCLRWGSMCMSSSKST
ncbi:hypothetical protein U9M48_008535 [Paspalum notatum var. saurae]|uniref:Uncharacterized protein n=1 Tax=Paspalum notatum var. saurae TaxID=547442 RepID=A0AAQ3SPS7_PASNO